MIFHSYSTAVFHAPALIGKGFADSVIEQVFAAMVRREGYVMRMPESVERLALVEVRASHFRGRD